MARPNLAQIYEKVVDRWWIGNKPPPILLSEYQCVECLWWWMVVKKQNSIEFVNLKGMVAKKQTS